MLPTPIEHLYVHIPFCHRICPYCGFYKHTPGKTDMEAFVDALLSELQSKSTELTIQPRTIFFGGGTPTMLSPTHLRRLLNGLHALLDLSHLKEWSIEANPRTFDLDKLLLLKDSGITRISLGVQSWQPRLLELLGRDHCPDEAVCSFQLIREANIPSASIDLMFSIPSQTPDEWQADINLTTSLAPDHISTYNLTYEEDTDFLTRLQNGEFTENPDEDANLFEIAWQKLANAGYQQYEISNFAKPGAESLHNRAYWHGHDFLGIGPGAVSTIQRRRWTGLADTTQYISCIQRFGRAETNVEILSDEQWQMERVSIELRTREGLSLLRLSQSSIDAIVPHLLAEKMARIADNHLHLTPKGRMLVDEIAARLLEDKPHH